MEKFKFLSNEATVDKTASFCITFRNLGMASPKKEDFSKNRLNPDIPQRKISEIRIPEKQTFFLLKQLSTVILPALKSARDACFCEVCYNQNQKREV